MDVTPYGVGYQKKEMKMRKLIRAKQIEAIVSVVARRAKVYSMDMCVRHNTDAEIKEATKKVAVMNRQLAKQIADFHADKDNVKFSEYNNHELIILFCLAASYYRPEVTVSTSVDLSELLLNEVEQFMPTLTSITQGNLAKFVKIGEHRYTRNTIYFEPVMPAMDFLKFMLE